MSVGTGPGQWTPPPPPPPPTPAYECPSVSCWCPLVSSGKCDRLHSVSPLASAYQQCLSLPFSICRQPICFCLWVSCVAPPSPPPPLAPAPHLALVALSLNRFCPLKCANHAHFLGQLTTLACIAADLRSSQSQNVYTVTKTSIIPQSKCNPKNAWGQQTHVSILGRCVICRRDMPTDTRPFGNTLCY